MDDGSREYFDDELRRKDPTLAEREGSEAIERLAGDVRAYVRSQPGPDLRGSVMRRVRALDARPSPAPTVVRGIAAALWRPRSFTIRPLIGLAAAAALGAIWIAGPGRTGSIEPPFAGDARSEEARVFVQFRLHAEGASSVRLAASFTDWQPAHALHEMAPGIWTLTLALPVGVHDYAFLVDGERWTPDPWAPHVDDGFGGRNSRLALLPPDGRRL